MEEVVVEPGMAEACDLLRDYLRREVTVQVNGRCRVSYRGRAKSSLDRGERLVIVKQDSALLVHGPDNYRPRNWQPQVDSWDVSLDDDQLVVVAERTDPDERVEIRFDDLSLLTVARLVDDSELQVRGHEVDIHEAIEDDPGIVEDGLTVIEREKKTPAGYIDVFARDGNGDYVVIEVKRNPDHNTVLQLQRYVDEIVDEFAGYDGDVRGVLVAPKMTDPVLDYLEERGLEFVEVAMEDVIASYDPLDTAQQGLDSFSTS